MKKEKTKEINGYKINLLGKLQEIIIDVNIPGLKIEFTEEEFNKIMEGYYSKSMEDKWNVIPDGNWVHICRSWTGDEVYRVEILKEKCEHGEYKIRSFFVDRSLVDEHFIEYADYSIYVLLIIFFWGILKKDIRHLIIEKYGKDEKDIVKLWSDFGSMLFIEGFE